MKKYYNVILIVLGCILIGSVLIYNRFSIDNEGKLLKDYEESIKLNALQELGKANSELDEQECKSQENNIEDITSSEQTDINQGIGILRIPTIELKSLIRDGSSEDIISSSLGHIETTAYPGQKGNFAVAGHRNYTGGRFFNRLDEVKIGDYVYVDTIDTTYTYQVTDISIVEDDDISVLEDTSEATITMITCTPAHVYIGAKRLIVRGKLVD